VISSYIVDFCCFDPKLVIEVDGSQHLDSIDADAERTRFLRKCGFRVLRFWNNEVVENVDGVMERIELQLNELKNGLTDQ
jgi:very-short-patch-repair endonuclease